jgi:hypothetical protein
LVHLRRLDLSSNRIEEIPDDFFHLSALEDLNLSRNHIRVIPPAIGALTQLTLFDLNGNLLKALPREVGHLVNLVEFDLGTVWIRELEIVYYYFFYVFISAVFTVFVFVYGSITIYSQARTFWRTSLTTWRR